MSQGNLDALIDCYRRWGAGDWTDTSLFDPYAVAVLPDPTPRPHYGLEALSQYMRRFLEAWKDIRMEATGYRQADNTFVVHVRRRAEGRESGIPLEDHVFHVWTFRGEKAIRLEIFEHEAEALKAAGMSK